MCRVSSPAMKLVSGFPITAAPRTSQPSFSRANSSQRRFTAVIQPSEST